MRHNTHVNSTANERCRWSVMDFGRHRSIHLQSEILFSFLFLFFFFLFRKMSHKSSQWCMVHRSELFYFLRKSSDTISFQNDEFTFCRFYLKEKWTKNKHEDVVVFCFFFLFATCQSPGSISNIKFNKLMQITFWWHIYFCHHYFSSHKKKI